MRLSSIVKVLWWMRYCEWYLVTLALTKDIRVLLQWRANQAGLLPQVWCQEAVGIGDGNVGGFESVLKCLCASGRGCVDVLDTGKLQQTLDSWRGDQSSTTWSRDELLRSVNAYEAWKGL